MDRFSRCMSLILLFVILIRSSLLLALSPQSSQLFEELVDGKRFSEVLYLSLNELQKPSCSDTCGAQWSRNAARSLLRIGDYDGALRYLQFALRLSPDGMQSKELLAFTALLMRDTQRWEQHRSLFVGPRSQLIEGLAGPEAFLPKTRQELQRFVVDPSLPADQQLQLQRYVRAEQTSPWLTGSLSALIPGSGLSILGMHTSAAQSFFLTASSAWASSELFQKNLRAPGFAAALIASVFYIGGIQATVRSTNEFNAQQNATDREQLMSWALPSLEFEWKRSF